MITSDDSQFFSFEQLRSRSSMSNRGERKERMDAESGKQKSLDRDTRYIKYKNINKLNSR